MPSSMRRRGGFSTGAMRRRMSHERQQGTIWDEPDVRVRQRSNTFSNRTAQKKQFEGMAARYGGQGIRAYARRMLKPQARPAFEKRKMESLNLTKPPVYGYSERD